MFRRRNRDHRQAGDLAAQAAALYDAIPDQVRHYTRGHLSGIGAALETWDWLDFEDKAPSFTSWFGHVVFVGRDGVWLLDPFDGSFERRWAHPEELLHALEYEEIQDVVLGVGLAMGAESRGMTLGDRQMFAFAPPPIVGGGFLVENLMPMDIEIGLDLAGQLHRQLRDLPPGTRVSGFVYDEESPSD